MKILVRLPNWLGDMVMAVGLLRQLPTLYPQAEVSVVAKKGLQELLDFFPAHGHRFVFNKADYKGLKGPWRFGREIRKKENFDLYISLPDSFSAALMGHGCGAEERIGYSKEGRDLLLTKSFAKAPNLHRVEEYIELAVQHSGRQPTPPTVRLQHSFAKDDYIVININSEAASRRLTAPKAVELISALRTRVANRLVLIGGPKEAEFVDAVYQQLPVTTGITSVAGKTSLAALAEILASASALLTTDSGPAHLANALGTSTVVLFGAGNEANTAPYDRAFCTVRRLGQLSCEPCTKNVCVRFPTPQCLEQLSTPSIIETLITKLPVHD